MTSRREFNEVLGRIITDRSFGDKFLQNPTEPDKTWASHLTAQELARLAKLQSQDIAHIRISLSV